MKRTAELFLVVLLGACGGLSSTAGESIGGGGGGAPGVPAATGSTTGSGDASATVDAGAPLPAGVLTAGAWDDNLNFDVYSAYLKKLDDAALAGRPITNHVARPRGQAAPATALDIVFVVDTTGSMGDEMQYLATEIEGIASTATTRYPGVAIRWGAMLYRDVNMGDEYTTRGYPLAPNVHTFQQFLAAQTASGGGDYPESPEIGLAEAATLGWNHAAGSARMVFWIGDAPAHNDRGGALLDSIRALDQQGVHVYPVAASGTDDLLEYSMRAAAQITGGCYQFLTDDSGIGGTHKEPTIPCYRVARWSAQMVRMIAIEATGATIPLGAGDILRESGTIHGDVCTLADGGTATAL